MLYQDSHKYQDLFSKSYAINQTDFVTASEIASSDAIRAQGGLSTLNTQLISVTDNELETYLTQIEESFNSTGVNAPFGILMSTVTHSMSLTYQKNKGWRFMDVNQYDPDDIAPLSIKQMVSLLKPYFRTPISENNAFFTAHLSIITTQNSLSSQQKTQLDQQLRRLPHNRLSKRVVIEKSHRIVLAFWAAMYGLVEILGWIVKPQPEVIQKSNQTDLLFFAVMYGLVEIFQEATKHGIDLNQAMINDVTPAYLAAEKGHVAVLQELAKHHANFNKARINGATPAFIAAQNGDKAIIGVLIKENADFNLPFVSTPENLKTFAEKHPAIVQERMQQFINKCGINIQKITMKPRDIAHIMGHSEIVQLLDYKHTLKEQQTVFAHLLKEVEAICATTQLQYQINPWKYKQTRQELNQLQTALKNQGACFFKTPSSHHFTAFHKACDWEIMRINLRGYSKKWESLHYIIKGILGVLAALFIIPMLLIEATTQQGYKGMFFQVILIRKIPSSTMVVILTSEVGWVRR